MKITREEIQKFWNKYNRNLKKEKKLVVLAFILLLPAMLNRRSIRKKYYTGNSSRLNTTLWHILKDDFKKQDRINGKNDYDYLDYGEKSFRERFKLLWFIPFKLNKSFFAAYMWMLRNNIWNYKETVAEEENGVYNDLKWITTTLIQGIKFVTYQLGKWAEIRYTDKNDSGVANRGDKFSFEHTIRGEQEVYYRTYGGLVHGRYSYVYTKFKLPFGYQIIKEIQKGAGGEYFRYRNKTKIIKFDEEL
jgi:hypothetical protein